MITLFAHSKLMLWLLSKNNIRAGTGRQWSLQAQNKIIHTGNLLHASVQTHTMAAWLPVRDELKLRVSIRYGRDWMFFGWIICQEWCKMKVCLWESQGLSLSHCICYTGFAGIRMQIRFSWSKHQWKSMTACRRRCVLKTYEVTLFYAPS